MRRAGRGERRSVRQREPPTCQRNHSNASGSCHCNANGSCRCNGYGRDNDLACHCNASGAYHYNGCGPSCRSNGCDLSWHRHTSSRYNHDRQPLGCRYPAEQLRQSRKRSRRQRLILGSYLKSSKKRNIKLLYVRDPSRIYRRHLLFSLQLPQTRRLRSGERLVIALHAPDMLR